MIMHEPQACIRISGLFQSVDKMLEPKRKQMQYYLYSVRPRFICESTLLSIFECDYLILDDIRAGNIFQKNLLSHGVKWLQFQNSLNINFYSNQLLYQNDLKHKKYKKFKNQKIYSGKEYIILRSEFYKKRVKFG